ncbi:transcriptional regulator [Escherichia coli]|nr:transcriptional regulator [Escherichia coli]
MRKKQYNYYRDQLLRFKEGEVEWICPYISRHLLSLNPLLACCRRYSRGER